MGTFAFLVDRRVVQVFDFEFDVFIIAVRFENAMLLAFSCLLFSALSAAPRRSIGGEGAPCPLGGPP